MFEHGHITFIGPGVMAEAMAAGLLDRGGLSPGRLLMSGPRANRLQDWPTLGLATATDNRSAVDRRK
jgi:pyrroline-5-carboxylate reductase